MPALLTSASIDWKRDRAVSTILAAVAGSPMWPSTRARRSEAATSVDWVTFRELATTLNPRSTNPFTIPAPIPCEAPVTMAVFRGLLMVVYLEKVLSLEKIRWSGSAIRVYAETQRRLVKFLRTINVRDGYNNDFQFDLHPGASLLALFSVGMHY